jgi:hypothetical protein
MHSLHTLHFQLGRRYHFRQISDHTQIARSSLLLRILVQSLLDLRASLSGPVRTLQRKIDFRQDRGLRE